MPKGTLTDPHACLDMELYLPRRHSALESCIYKPNGERATESQESKAGGVRSGIIPRAYGAGDDKTCVWKGFLVRKVS